MGEGRVGAKTCDCIQCIHKGGVIQLPMLEKANGVLRVVAYVQVSAAHSMDMEKEVIRVRVKEAIRMLLKSK